MVYTQAQFDAAMKLRKTYQNYLKIGQEFLYLSEQDCMDTGVTDAEIIDATEKGMMDYSKKLLEMPAKIGIHPMEDSLMHAMPANLPDQYSCGIKWGSNFPTNRKQFPDCIPTNCQILYNDALTGHLLSMMDASWITKRRTPATALVSIKHGANLDAKTFGMIGCGIQGTNNVDMVENILKNLETIYIYDPFPAAMDKLVEAEQLRVKAKIVKCPNLEDLVRNSDVIVSATPISHTPKPFVPKEWIHKGQTLVCLDCHSVYEDAVYKMADRYYMDSIEEHELLAGYGYYPWGLPTITGETGALAAGLVPGRESKDDILIFNNVGMASEDMMCARIIFDKALEKGLGIKLPLWTSTKGLLK